MQIINGETFSGNVSFVTRNLMFGSRNLSFSDSTDGFNLSDHTIEQTYVDTLSAGFRGESVIVDGNSIRVINYRVERSIAGQFTVRAPFTGGEPLRVSINLAFEDTATQPVDDPSFDYPGRDTELPFEWQTGEVTITANDGSSMRIQPSSGNTFMIWLGTGETLGPFAWTGQFELTQESPELFAD